MLGKSCETMSLTKCLWGLRTWKPCLHVCGFVRSRLSQSDYVTHGWVCFLCGNTESSSVIVDTTTIKIQNQRFFFFFFNKSLQIMLQCSAAYWLLILMFSTREWSSHIYLYSTLKTETVTLCHLSNVLSWISHKKWEHTLWIPEIFPCTKKKKKWL